MNIWTILIESLCNGKLQYFSCRWWVQGQKLQRRGYICLKIALFHQKLLSSQVWVDGVCRFLWYFTQFISTTSEDVLNTCIQGCYGSLACTMLSLCEDLSFLFFFPWNPIEQFSRPLKRWDPILSHRIPWKILRWITTEGNALVIWVHNHWTSHCFKSIFSNLGQGKLYKGSWKMLWKVNSLTSK